MKVSTDRSKSRRNVFDFLKRTLPFAFNAFVFYSTLCIEFGEASKKAPTLPAQFCDNYSQCLQKLQTKQQECMRFTPDAMELRRSTSRGFMDSTNTSATIECTRKKRKDLLRELGELQMKKNRLVVECLMKNMNKAKSILNPKKEKKCLATKEKLPTVAEIIKESEGKKERKFKNAVHNHKNNNKEKGGKDKKSHFGSTTAASATKTMSTAAAVTTTTNSPSTTSSPLSTSNGSGLLSRMKRGSRRREAVAKKQNAKACKRAKKSLSRKCHQMAKCCSIVTECQLSSEAVEEQINNTKMELKSPSCNS